MARATRFIHVLRGLTAVAVWLGQAQAQEPTPAPALVVTAENLMADDERHRLLAERGGDPQTLLPGDTVRFRITFTNLQPTSVRNVQFRNPVPAGLRYLLQSAGSDRADVTIEYSIDEGASYWTSPMVEEVVEGRPVRRPAPPELYTHIQWSLHGWVTPGSRVTAEFRAELPAMASNR